MTADRPATEPHPWENHDDSCQCHITICADCGCTNEIVPAEAAQGAAPHHNHDGCNPYDEAHVAGKSGAAPRAEGLVSIRDALDYFLPFIGRDFAAKEAQERIDQRVKAAQALAPLAAPRAEGLTCGVCEKPITGEAVCMDCFDRNVDGG